MSETSEIMLFHKGFFLIVWSLAEITDAFIMHSSRFTKVVCKPSFRGTSKIFRISACFILYRYLLWFYINVTKVILKKCIKQCKYISKNTTFRGISHAHICSVLDEIEFQTEKLWPKFFWKYSYEYVLYIFMHSFW